MALQAIVKGWGGDRVLGFLQDRAVNDPEPTARAAALQAIARRWLFAHVRAFLQDRAVNDPEPTARAAALLNPFHLLMPPRGSAIRGWPWRAGRRARGSSGACAGSART